MPEAIELHLEGLREAGLPIPTNNTPPPLMSRLRLKTRLTDGNGQPFVVHAPVVGLSRRPHNASLGLAGEELIVLAEQRRLHDAGKRALSNRVEHVSRTKGDGVGYDIVSFELDGRERLIEVKTTAFGKTTPFFASRREVQVSAELGLQYHLYRLFKFRDAPKAFILSGSLRDTCSLDPAIFVATAR